MTTASTSGVAICGRPATVYAICPTSHGVICSILVPHLRRKKKTR
jgi:hypothetical protein